MEYKNTVFLQDDGLNGSIETIVAKPLVFL
jgi:hypothetical protein